MVAMGYVEDLIQRLKDGETVSPVPGVKLVWQEVEDFYPDTSNSLLTIGSITFYDGTKRFFIIIRDSKEKAFRLLNSVPETAEAEVQHHVTMWPLQKFQHKIICNFASESQFIEALASILSMLEQGY
ncbi:MAG: hypothetical protein KatS3mg087_0497 [Patescibacteria group bacterium]|nr:MAG: hypothetical protein KatS3mg087_0497 [Patescibacteria group bacterium]